MNLSKINLSLPQFKFKLSYHIETAIHLLFAVYIVFLLPKLTLKTIVWMDSTVVKVLLFLFVLSISLEHPQLAILVVISILLTYDHLDILKKMKNRPQILTEEEELPEEREEQQKPTQTQEETPTQTPEETSTQTQEETAPSNNVEKWDPRVPKNLDNLYTVKTNVEDKIPPQVNLDLGGISKKLQSNSVSLSKSDKSIEKLRSCAFGDQLLKDNSPFFKSTRVNPDDQSHPAYQMLQSNIKK